MAEVDTTVDSHFCACPILHDDNTFKKSRKTKKKTCIGVILCPIQIVAILFKDITPIRLFLF